MSPREWINDIGSGPFIAAMIFIVAITAGSVLFAKYCVGERAFMRTGYDFEGYVMRKCPLCVGLPKRTYPRVRETGPHEVEVQVVEEVRASEPPPPVASAPAPAPASAPTPASAAAAAVAIAIPAAAKEEEDEDNEDLEEEDDDDDDFDFEAAEALGL